MGKQQPYRRLATTKVVQLAAIKRDFIELLQLLVAVAGERTEEVQVPEQRARKRIYAPLWD